MKFQKCLFVQSVSHYRWTTNHCCHSSMSTEEYPLCFRQDSKDGALAMYQYVITFKPAECHDNADAMSYQTSPLSHHHQWKLSAWLMASMKHQSQLYRSRTGQVKGVAVDQAGVARKLSRGCPLEAVLVEDRTGLYHIDGCVFRGSRVTVPESGSY